MRIILSLQSLFKSGAMNKRFMGHRFINSFNFAKLVYSVPDADFRQFFLNMLYKGVSVFFHCNNSPLVFSEQNRIIICVRMDKSQNIFAEYRMKRRPEYPIECRSPHL